MKKSLIKRLPFKRGRLKLRPGVKPQEIGIDKIQEHFKKGDKVNESTLIAKGLITKEILRTKGVKIVGMAKASPRVDFEFEVPVSKTLFTPENNKKSEKVSKKSEK